MSTRKMKMRQQRYMWELYSFISDMTDLFADLDNSFHIMEECFLKFFVLYSHSNG